jgi:hypothetical protein
MEDNTKENGWVIRCMDRVLLCFLMAENMWGIILMIKRKDMVNSFGLMVKFIKGNGKMESNMDMEL